MLYGRQINVPATGVSALTVAVLGPPPPVTTNCSEPLSFMY
ncbi:hypothetical protein NIES2135_60100 (plasmid) [Leptolyngbya boryana NIES-2135]|uniref:Uncharacterized protein n=1 Tax=Leptolyngbya boryana NIES-2135 TaxID=1973484 RepID=A0A1Z4JR40_LEPBY|nr:hypothetical protein NIES2135_60100 [Leptolyngbya boryana NIES-2135]